MVLLFSKNPLSKKALIFYSAAAAALVAIVYWGMLYIVFPVTDNFVSIYVPSKSGGKDYFVRLGEFESFGGIVLAIAMIAVFAVVIALRYKKYAAASLVALVLAFSAIMYAALFFGNAFDELWGGYWSVAGAVLVLVIGMFIEFPLLGNLAHLSKKQK